MSHSVRRSLLVGAAIASLAAPLLANPPQADDAQVVSSDFPASLAAGETGTARVTVRNSGTATWTTDYRLGAVDDSDPFAEGRIYFPDGTRIAPGGEHTFTIALTAPSNPGDHRTDWRMVHEGVRWFGASVVKTITVTQPQEDGAAIVSADLPSVLDAGQTFDAQVTVKNTGTATWTRDTHKLGAVDDSDPLHGPDARVYLPQGVNVAPGDSWTFRIPMRAPQGKGTYKTDWRMVHEGVRWFGGLAERDVTVVSDQVDNTTLEKKLVMGYQGWFACRGDNSAVNDWVHWSRGSPGATTMTVDMWPDVRELDPDELFDSGLKLPDGSAARLFSSQHPKTVMRHFKWMKDAGVDGVMLQRFTVGLGDRRLKEMNDKVTQNVRAGAEAHGRIWCVMYDISSHRESTLVDDIKADFDHLVNTVRILDSGRYIHHRGRPLIALWGVGVEDRPGTAQQVRELVDFFHARNVSVKLGVGSGWRTLEGVKKDPAWHDVYRSAEVISPWYVGAFANEVDATSHARGRMLPDLQECKARNIDYMPVVWPGFSWHNLQRGASPYNAIPRNGGRFYWKQVANVIEIGCSMVYNAMFDEVDEGTAMLKIAPTRAEAPVTPGFVTADADGEALPSDWYLRLAGEASKMLRGDRPFTASIPIKP